MDEHGQSRRETTELTLPVAEHRYRTDDKCRAVGGIHQKRGDELRGLAQSHVVRETGAQPQSPEKRQPADPALLVRAKVTVEPCGCRDRLDGGVERFVEQRT